MSNDDHNRVFSRTRARELTQAETEKIAGDGTSTFATAFGSYPQHNADLDE